MAKSAKKKKKRDRDLVERLRRLGLRKQSAKNVADTVTNVKGQLPDSARSAINDFIAKVDDLRERAAEKGKPHDHDPGVDGSGEKAAKKQGKKAGKKKAGKKGKSKGKKKGKKAAKATAA
jgi:hypothetical protein